MPIICRQNLAEIKSVILVRGDLIHKIIHQGSTHCYETLKCCIAVSSFLGRHQVSYLSVIFDCFSPVAHGFGRSEKRKLFFGEVREIDENIFGCLVAKAFDLRSSVPGLCLSVGAVDMHR